MLSRFLQLILVGCFLCFACGQLSAKDFSQGELRKIVQKAIKNKSSLIEDLEFKMDFIALYYNFGGVVRPDGQERTALQFPTDLQFKVELLRQYPWRAINRKVWDSYLPKVEQVVANQLKVIREFKRDGKELLKHLQDLEEKGLGLFKDALQIIANRECRHLAPIGTVFVRVNVLTPYGPVITYVPELKVGRYIKGHRVEIKSNPPLGKVFYLTQADYEIAEENGLLSQDSAWNRTSEGEHTLGGVFFFRAKWQDGKIASPCRWPIESSRTITLTPD